MRLSLEWTDGDAGAPASCRLTDRPLRIGRGLDNDVVLTHASVSGHHAVVTRVGDDAVLADLRSTNGTTVNGVPVTRARTLEDGDIVGFGDAVFAVARLVREAAAPQLYVEDLAAGRVHRVQDGALALGGVVVRFVAEGECIAVVTPEGRRVVGFEEPVEVAGRALRVRRPAPAETTRRSPGGTFPYRVEALLGPEGATARFGEHGRIHAIEAENRALLVWILARRLADDRARGATEAGWCPDADVRVGIWGVQARDLLDNNLNVVISRTRRELGEHGFDGRCIDRRRGETRLLVADVRVESR